MPVEFQHRIYPADCRARPDTLFVFGDNFHRQGKAGQAIIRDEPNAVGLATKHLPSMAENAFLKDDHILKLMSFEKPHLLKLMDHVLNGGVIVWPKDGIGTGLAQLMQRAPLIAHFYAIILQDLCETPTVDFPGMPLEEFESIHCPIDLIKENPYEHHI